MSFFERLLDFEDDLEMKECFKFFDKGGKTFLDGEDMYSMLRSLFRTDKSFPEDAAEALDSLSLPDRCEMTREDLGGFWYGIVRLLHRPVSALVVVDLQNDFIEGSLALKGCPAGQDALDLVPVVNALLQSVKFDCVAYTQDWHPRDHVSFFENVDSRPLLEPASAEGVALFDTVTFQASGGMQIQQKLWPVHCVQDTWGAQLHPKLQMADKAVSVLKGTDPEVDSYSAFWDNMRGSATSLHAEFQKRGVTHVFVCGVALDYCAGYTALDALELGYATAVVEDATRGTDRANMASMREKLVANSCVMVRCSEVNELVMAKDIRHQFGKVFAKTAAKR